MAEGFSGAYYEVGNENDGSWNPMLSVEAYTDRFVLLDDGRSRRSIRRPDSMGPVASSYHTKRIEGFLDRLALVGGTGLLDWVSYHHYGGWISNSNTNGIDLGEPQEYGDGLDGLRAGLASRGLARVKIAVTEMNAAIWDTGCTRDQFTIKQGLWLADALGVSLVRADAANVWIHLHPGADPHALIDSDATPPAATKNYGPVALAAQTLSASDPTAPVEVLSVALGAGSSVLSGYAARKADGTLGVLLLNRVDGNAQDRAGASGHPPGRHGTDDRTGGVRRGGGAVPDVRQDRVPPGDLRPPGDVDRRAGRPLSLRA